MYVLLHNGIIFSRVNNTISMNLVQYIYKVHCKYYAGQQKIHFLENFVFFKKKKINIRVYSIPFTVPYIYVCMYIYLIHTVVITFQIEIEKKK